VDRSDEGTLSWHLGREQTILRNIQEVLASASSGL